MCVIVFSCPHNKCSLMQTMSHHICHSIKLIEFFFQTRKLNRRKTNSEDSALILMAIDGLWLQDWVITLSLPSSNSIGRRSMSLGCQLLLKALLTQRCSFCLFISRLCLDFPHYRHVWEYLWLKHNIVFSFWKRNQVNFFFIPLAKDTIPSGESYVYRTTSTMPCQDKGPLLHF